jgi:hypothetical protein
MTLDSVVAENEHLAGYRWCARALHATRGVLRAAEAIAIGEGDTCRLVGSGKLRGHGRMRPVRRASLAVEMKAEQVVAPELHARKRAALDVRDGTTNRAERFTRGGVECSVGLGGSHEVRIADGPHRRRAPSGSVVAKNGNAGNRRCDEHAVKDRAWRRILHFHGSARRQATISWPS